MRGLHVLKRNGFVAYAAVLRGFTVFQGKLEIGNIFNVVMTMAIGAVVCQGLFGYDNFVPEFRMELVDVGIGIVTKKTIHIGDGIRVGEFFAIKSFMTIRTIEALVRRIFDDLGIDKEGFHPPIIHGDEVRILMTLHAAVGFLS